MLSRDPYNPGSPLRRSADGYRVEKTGVDVKADRRIVVGDLRVASIGGSVKHPIVLNATLVADGNEVALRLRLLDTRHQKEKEEKEQFHGCCNCRLRSPWKPGRPIGTFTHALSVTRKIT